MYRDKVENIDGTIYHTEVTQKIAYAISLTTEYVNEKTFEDNKSRMVGDSIKGDTIGDLRRAMLFLVLVHKEMINDRENELGYRNSYYIEKYQTEKYRDYLVCRGLPHSIVDNLFDLYELYYDDEDEDEVGGETLETGIGYMSIEDNINPFKIF